MRIGVTGHQRLGQRLQDQDARISASDAWRWVEQVFADVLAGLQQQHADIAVVSCLAGGADQRLSTVALAQGVSLHAVIPCAGYEETFATEHERSVYTRLAVRAEQITRLTYPAPSEEAYFAGGKVVVDASKLLVAVWDEREAEGVGGTGDVVAYALRRGRRVLVFNPISRMDKVLSTTEEGGEG